MKGNAVMKAKRTTGPTPNTVLTTLVRCESCAHCAEHPAVVKTLGRNGGTLRLCMEHVKDTSVAPQRRFAFAPTIAATVRPHVLDSTLTPRKRR